MMEVTPSNTNGLEIRSIKTLFKKDLKALENLFPEEVLAVVENNIDSLTEDYVAWQRALTVIAKRLGVKADSINKIPGMIEQTTFENIRSKFSIEKPFKIVLGIAGPGAVGKETIKKKLGFKAVVNTTTRPRRNYEVQGEHYHFIDKTEFRKIISENGFIVSMERPGRGYYGIQKKDIKDILSGSKTAMIEENPVNLINLVEYLKTYENCELVLVYILPPSPILPNLAARLADRCLKSGHDFKSAISSTLNLRQVHEFNSIADSLFSQKCECAFLINDDVERVVKKVKDLIE